METVLVPIIDKNKLAQSYIYLKMNKTYIALNSETYISLRTQELAACKKISCLVLPFFPSLRIHSKREIYFLHRL